MTFGQKIRRLRETHELTQSDLGAILNTTQRKKSYRENNRNEPCPEDVRMICRYFKVSADDLLEISDDLPKDDEKRR